MYVRQKKLTISRPLLLGRALAPELGNLQALEPVFFLLVPRHEVELGEFLLDVLDGRTLAWVVGGQGGALEALAQDLVAEARVARVEGGGEEG